VVLEIRTGGTVKLPRKTQSNPKSRSLMLMEGLLKITRREKLGKRGRLTKLILQRFHIGRSGK